MAASDKEHADREPDPESVAHTICLQLLDRAPRTMAQLADAMRRRRVPDDAAEAVLARLSRVGLVDDAAYAAAWVDSRQRTRGVARRALTAELRRRGVPPEITDEAVAQVRDEDEEAAARALVAARLPRLGNLDATARTRRLLGLLQRKGYSAGLAYRVVRDAVDSADDPREVATIGPE